MEEVDGEGCNHGYRLRLTAQPVSKSTVFDMNDLEELIHLLRNRPTGEMVRCSKAHAMFAMWACSKAVMVGMPLNKQQISLLGRQLYRHDASTMALSPWKTYHLLDLSDLNILSGMRSLKRRVD